MANAQRIVVTEEVVARACQRDSRHCMVAEAIQGAQPDWKNISVDLATIRWTNPRTRRRYTALTPDSIRNAIFAFDQGQPVEPFDFALRAIHTIKSTAGTKKGTVKRRRAQKQQAEERANPTVSMGSGRPVIRGGSDLPAGHLGGTPTPTRSNRVEVETTDAGNVRLSGGRFRQYGLRQLRA